MIQDTEKNRPDVETHVEPIQPLPEGGFLAVEKTFNWEDYTGSLRVVKIDQIILTQLIDNKWCANCSKSIIDSMVPTDLNNTKDVLQEESSICSNCGSKLEDYMGGVIPVESLGEYTRENLIIEEIEDKDVDDINTNFRTRVPN